MNIYEYIENQNEEIKKIKTLDALIFSRLSYIHIEELEDKLPFTINDLFNYRNNIKMNAKDQKLLELLSKSKRYKDLMIVRCQSILDYRREEQFFACTISLPNYQNFIAFRGTDKTTVGLKEDLNMSYMVVPSAISAKEYVNSEKGLKRIILAGHSKGGHLAIQALMKCKNPRRIQKVYNFDGPGVLELDKEFYRVSKKIVNYYPDCSIVGRLLQNDSKKTFFATTISGISAHNIYYWIIQNDELKKSNVLKISNDWALATEDLLEKIIISRRKEIIESVLEVFQKKNINFSEIKNFEEIKRIVMSIPKLTKEEKNYLSSYLKQFFNIMFFGKSLLKKKGKEENESNK